MININSIKIIDIVIIISLFFTSAYSQQVSNYVDLYICTSRDHWQLDASATVPFGRIKLGHDTDPGNHSGYKYDTKKSQVFLITESEEYDVQVNEEIKE